MGMLTTTSLTVGFLNCIRIRILCEIETRGESKCGLSIGPVSGNCKVNVLSVAVSSALSSGFSGSGNPVEIVGKGNLRFLKLAPYRSWEFKNGKNDGCGAHEGEAPGKEVHMLPSSTSVANLSCCTRSILQDCSASNDLTRIVILSLPPTRAKLVVLMAMDVAADLREPLQYRRAFSIIGGSRMTYTSVRPIFVMRFAANGLIEALGISRLATILWLIRSVSAFVVAGSHEGIMNLVSNLCTPAGNRKGRSDSFLSLCSSVTVCKKHSLEPVFCSSKSWRNCCVAKDAFREFTLLGRVVLTTIVAATSNVSIVDGLSS